MSEPLKQEHFLETKYPQEGYTLTARTEIHNMAQPFTALIWGTMTIDHSLYGVLTVFSLPLIVTSELENELDDFWAERLLYRSHRITESYVEDKDMMANLLGENVRVINVLRQYTGIGNKEIADSAPCECGCTQWIVDGYEDRHFKMGDDQVTLVHCLKCGRRDEWIGD